MAHKRPNPEVLDEIDRRIGALQRQIHLAEELARGKETPFWKAVKGLVQDKLDDAEWKLDRFEQLTPDERVENLQQRIDMKMFLAMPESAAAGLDDLRERLAQAEAERVQRRARLGV